MSSTFNIVELETFHDAKKYGLKVEIPMKMGWIENVELVAIKDNNPIFFSLKHYKNDDDCAIFIGEATLPTSALYHYYFKYNVGDKTKYIKNSKTDDTYVIPEEMYKMSVNYNVPEWAKGKIMYHIFLDRFSHSDKLPMSPMPRRYIHKSWEEEPIIGPNEDGIWNNDFFGGNIKGIIEKLDYLKSLGVSILYLSPIVFSQSNHRYDTSDYEQIDPYAGALDDLKNLCEEAHKMGMRIVLDAVFNHTGNDSKYFNQYQDKKWNNGLGAYWTDQSEYSKFYAKEYNSETGQWMFKYWWGIKTMPKCDCYSKQWQEYITGQGGIIDKWFSLGIDGLRLDVADDLTDEFIELIRIAVKRNKIDGFILGEVWENPMTKEENGYRRKYLKDGKGMDSVMNYNFIESLIKYFRYADEKNLQEKIREIKTTYPEEAIYTAMNFTSTHDMTRGINLWDNNIFSGRWPWDLKNNDHEFLRQYKLDSEEYRKAREIYQAYVFTLAFMPGILSIFYGDEAGLQGIGNLLNRRPFPWEKEDKDLQDFFKYIGKIRNTETFLETADIKIVDITKEILTFKRENNEANAIIAVNRTEEEKEILLPSGYEKGKIYTLKKSTPKTLSPYGAIAITKK